MAWVSTVDFAAIVTGIGTLAGAIAVVYVAIKGARMGLGFLRS
jgi:hypothetical protein